ncbi:N-6 DNA methylase [Streptomyces thermolineatus]|uniref:N-6 DNA methylase n=1 Tax=Streptomyces thermolineatus TaxID=44033 RepID=A0ABN3KSK5_9ACTN
MTTAREAASPIVPETSAWRITYAEIAALAQVQRPVPTNWSRRHPDFPAPVAHEDGRPLFDAREVVAWLAGTGRGNADPRHLRAELVLHTLSAWRTPALPASVLVGALTALTCLRQQHDREVSGEPWDTLMARAADLDAEDGFLLSELRSIPDPGRTGPALAELADELTEAAYTPAEAFDWVLEARRRLGSHDLAADEPTPVVVRALAALSGIDTLGEGAVVATPYARTGDLLAALHDRAPEDSGHTYLASDPDPARVRLVRRRMLVRGVYEFNLDVVEGEDLSSSVDAWGYPDLLACVLPYEPAETRSPRAVLERVQALADYLGTGSTAVVLGPADVLVRPLPPHGDADRLRRSFLREGLLKAAISLPDGVFPYRPGHRTAVWVLARTPAEERTGLVLLSDFSARPLTGPVLDALAEDVAIWRASGWRGDRRHEPRNAAVLPAKDLDDRPGTAFTPHQRPAEARYTRAVLERPALIGDLERRLAELQEQAREQAGARTALHLGVVLRSGDQPVRRTTVRRLVEKRRLRRRPGHRIAPEHLTAEGHYPVLGPEEILGTIRPGSRRIDRGLLLTAYEHAQFTEPGDIVVTASPRFGVHVDAEGLSVVAAPARVLRVRPDADPPLRPRVLAALLRAAAAEYARTSGAVRASRAIEDLIVPDLGREEAERYDAALAEIEHRAALLREQSAALDDLARITAAGIADGTLTFQDLPAPHDRDDD